MPSGVTTQELAGAGVRANTPVSGAATTGWLALGESVGARDPSVRAHAASSGIPAMTGASFKRACTVVLSGEVDAFGRKPRACGHTPSQ